MQISGLIFSNFFLLIFSNCIFCYKFQFLSIAFTISGLADSTGRKESSPLEIETEMPQRIPLFMAALLPRRDRIRTYDDMTLMQATCHVK